MLVLLCNHRKRVTHYSPEYTTDLIVKHLKVPCVVHRTHTMCTLSHSHTHTHTQTHTHTAHTLQHTHACMHARTHAHTHTHTHTHTTQHTHNTTHTYTQAYEKPNKSSTVNNIQVQSRGCACWPCTRCTLCVVLVSAHLSASCNNHKVSSPPHCVCVRR